MSCVLAGTEILFPIWILHHVSRRKLSEKAALCFDVTGTGFFSGIETTQVNPFFVKRYTRLVCIASRVEIVTFFSVGICTILTNGTWTYVPRLIIAWISICMVQPGLAGIFSVYPSAYYSMRKVSTIFYRHLNVTLGTDTTSQSAGFTFGTGGIGPPKKFSCEWV